MVFSPPVNSMRLKGIAAVWTEEHNPSTGAKDTDHLPDGEAIVLYVFDHLVAEDQVKCGGRKRDKFACGIDDVRRSAPGLRRPFEIIFQPNDLTSEGREVLHIHPHSTSVLKNSAF